jgi:hypothetical protein
MVTNSRAGRLPRRAATLASAVLLCVACYEIDELDDVPDGSADGDEDAHADPDADVDIDTDTWDTETDVDADTDIESWVNPEVAILGWIDDGTRLNTLAFSGTHVAIAYGLGDDTDADPYGGLRFAVFPVDDPASAVVTPLPSPCFETGEAYTQPFPWGDGFAIWTRAWSGLPAPPAGCVASRVVLGTSGETLEDSVLYGTQFYGNVWFAWFPTGILGEDGSLLTTQTWAIEEGAYAGQVYFRSDRLAADGSQALLGQQLYAWPEPFGPNDDLDMPFARRRVFEHDGVVANVAFDYRWGGVSSLVLTTSSEDGAVLLSPAPVFEVPGNPEATTHIVPAFAQRGGEILAVLAHWNVEDDDPYSSGQSFVFDFDGTLLEGPTELPSLTWDQAGDSIMQYTGLAWDEAGGLYGTCYRPFGEGYEFLALNADGAPASDPIELKADAAELPTSENGFCDVVAIGEDLFAVSFAIRAAPDGVEPGLYVAYVSTAE